MATSANTREDFDNAFKAGFDLFHGAFFKSSSVVAKKSISSNQALLLDLSAHTVSDGDIAVVEAIFKRNPELAFGLFNLVHSALYHVSENVKSIREAISVLGFKNLHKWAALMLFAIDHSDPSSNPLFENALIRARAMELAAAQLNQRGLSETAYMTGVLSLVQALFDVSMEELLAKGHFGEDVRSALLQRAGCLGGMVEMVEALERGQYEECSRSAEKLGIGIKHVLAAQTTAIMECHVGMDRSREKVVASEGARGRLKERRHAGPGSGNDMHPKKPSWIRRVLAALHLA